MKFWQKAVSFIATFSVLFNAIAAPLSVLAQETPTPEPTSVPTDTPASDPTIAPSEEPTLTPEASPTLEATATAEATVVPTPVDELTPTPETSQPPVQETTNENAQSQAPPDGGTSPTPLVTPLAPTEEGILSAVILDNTAVDTSSLDQFDLTYQTDGSATISTDKLDYAPTDTVLITGVGFTPDKTYTINITSQDSPAVDFNDTVTADSQGHLFYSYQLDGNYRPNYKVEIKDVDFVVASTTFTDTPTATLFPNGQGTYTSWDGDESDIDEIDTPSCSSNDAIIENTSNARESVYINLSSIPNDSTITSVEITAWDRGDSSSGGTYRTFARLNGTDTDAGANLATSTSQNNTCTLRGPQTIDVTDTVKSGSTTLEIGVLKTSTNTNTVRVGAIRAVVNYTEAADTTAPTVTINQAAGQIDPTATSPINFTVVFSESVSNFITGDVSLSGTAGATTAVVTGGGTTYNVAVSGMTGAGTVIASIDAGKASDAAGNPNTASTSTDHTVTYTFVPNPNLVLACGIKIVLILDSSDSMDNGDITDEKNAANLLVNALMPATPTQIGVIDFDTDVISSLSPTSVKTDVLNAISSIGHTGAIEYTNWDEALQTADAMVGAGDLVVIITDGNPTVSNGPLSDLDDAIARANSIKSGESRILAIGVNSGGTGGGLDLGNLEAITGPNDITIPPGTITNINNVDVILGDVSQLGTVLAGLTTALCGGTITAQKLIDQDGNLQTTNDQTPAENWTFDVNGAPSNPAPEQTDSQGFTPAMSVEPGTYSVTETVENGYGLVSAMCTVNNQSVGSPVTNGVGSITIGSSDIVSCTFINTPNVQLPSHICHATGNPNQWVFNQPANLGQLMGHVGIGHQSGNDIIPPISVFLPLGQNWNALGEAIWNNDCEVPPTTGSVKVNKLLDNDGNGTFETTNPGSFTWSLDGSGTNAMGSTVDDIEEGPHSVNESSVSGYHFVGWYPTGSTQMSCSSIPEATIYKSLPAAISVSKDATTDITLCNARDTGSIKVHKDVVNSNGDPVTDQSVDFTMWLDGVTSKVVSDGNEITFGSVPTGTHTITESDISNYSLVSILPDSDLGTPGAQVSVNVGAETEVWVINKQDPGNISGTKYDTSQNTLPGWTVELFACAANYETCSPTPLATDVTDANGFYSFTNLISGYYRVIETMQTGWVNAGVTSHDVTIGPGTESQSNDFTNFELGKILGRKFEDLNQNGISDPGEEFLNGWQIRVYKWGDGWQTFESRTTGHTGNDGEYTVVDLPQGLYKVCEVLQTGWGQTEPTGTANNVASDEAPVCRTFEVSTTGQEFNDSDFGNIQYGNVVVVKYYDKNGDGIKDGDEETLNGWEMQLTPEGGETMYQQTGNGDPSIAGQVTFSDLLPGTYNLAEQIKDGWDQTNIECDGEEAIDDDNSHPVVLAPGEDLTCYIGNIGSGSIHGQKWDDENKNGENDEENLLSGWTINLYKDSGEDVSDPYVLIDSMETDGSLEEFGWYWFEHLIPGNYKVCEVLKPDWEQTYPGEDGCHYITLPDTNPGSFEVQLNAVEIPAPVYNFGNFEQILGVSIEKSNNKPDGISAGQSLIYTVTLTNTGTIPAFNATITDILPGGFHYVTGSTTGDTTDDPTISGSHLSWNMGTLNAGESVTVHYEVQSDSNLTDGDYINYATCSALSRSEKEALCDPAANSTVRIGNGSSFGGSLGGQVLGASTELPATGSPTAVLLIALGLITAGFIIKKKYAKN